MNVIPIAILAACAISLLFFLWFCAATLATLV
jgi:hypothetical protein